MPPDSSGQKPNIELHLAETETSTMPSTLAVTVTTTRDNDDAIVETFKVSNVTNSNETTEGQVRDTLNQGQSDGGGGDEVVAYDAQQQQQEDEEGDTSVAVPEVDQTTELQKTVMKIITIKDFVT